MKKIKSKVFKYDSRGFSMIELLAVITIIGVISIIGIGAVSKLVMSSKKHYYETQQKQMVMAAQSYANDNRDVKPKNIGEVNTVTLETLMNKKYITGEIVDQDKKVCSPTKSYVDIYKSSQTDYIYQGYLECPACSKNGENCYNETKQDPGVSVELKQQKDDSLFDENNKIKITYRALASGSDPKILVSSYSYKIYVNGKLMKNSGVKVNNKKQVVTVNKDPVYLYVPGKIKVVATVTNTKGRTKTTSTTVDFTDAKYPGCGQVTYEDNNKMPAYEYSQHDSILCEPNSSNNNKGYKWINIANETGTRQAWQLCNDKKGVGCKQHEFSANMTEDGENENLELVDTNNNPHNCPIKKCIDRTSSKITMKIMNGSTVKHTLTVNPQSKEVDFKQDDKTFGTWLNKKDFPNGVTVEVTVEDPTSQVRNFKWEDSAEEKSEETIGKINHVIYEDKNITQKAASAAASTKKHTRKTTYTKDGVRRERITTEDYAGNKVTYDVILKIDMTPPPVPKASYYLTNSASATSGTSYSYTDQKWYSKHLYVTTTHPTDKPDISHWKTNQYTSTGAYAKKEINANTLNMSTEGETHMKWRSCDNANNCSEYCEEKLIRLDRTNPKCSVTYSPAANSYGWYRSGTVTATGTCSDQANLSGCKNDYKKITVDTVNSNSPDSGGTKKTKYVYDNAENKINCDSTIKYDKSDPTCSTSKSHTYETGGVTIKTTCTDKGPPSGILSCEGTMTGKKTGTYTSNVKDKAGNTNTCKTTVSAQRQKRTRTWNTCKTGSPNECFGEYKYVHHSNVCSENATCSKGSKVNRSVVNRGSLSCPGLETYDCKYWDSCSYTKNTCKGGWNDWSGWSNVSSCTESSTYHSKEVDCRTLYY